MFWYIPHAHQEVHVELSTSEEIEELVLVLGESKDNNRDEVWQPSQTYSSLTLDVESAWEK
jgi:hypothetical protein